MTGTTRRAWLASLAGAFAARSAAAREFDPSVLREAAESAGVAYAAQGIRPEKIKITDVRVTPLSYVDPNRNLWRSDGYITWKTDAALCQVFTDQGIVGIAEGTPYAGPDAIKKYTEEIIKPLIVGRNPFDADFFAFGGADRQSAAPWAGVNNACWDIMGKAKGVPVYRLLAGNERPATRLRIYASGGDYHEWYADGEKVLIEEALKYKAMGFTAFKFRSGTTWKASNMTLDRYIPIMRRLRREVGPGMLLIHETLRAQGLTTDEVVAKFCPMLEEEKFHWFEEPMRTMEDYIRINRALPTVKVSGGESHRTRLDVKPWLEQEAYEIVQTDCNVTGISENWFIARMAHLLGKPLCPHNWHGGLTTIANAHLVAAIPNRHMLELNMTHNPLKEEIFKEPLVAVKGYMDLPSRPGFGVELIPDVEKKFPFEPGSYSRPNPRVQKG